MKKFIGIACMAGLVAFAADAGAAAKWSAGVKGGVALGDVSGDSITVDTSMRTGFAGGAFVSAKFTDQFGARLEGLYVQKGAEADDPSSGDKITLKYDYIEFPLLFVAHLPAGESFCFDIFAGPTFGFNVKAEAKDADAAAAVDIKDFTESFEFGAAVGVGGEYALSSLSIIGDARYSLGATDVDKDGGFKTRTIEIMLGVAFPLGGE